MPQPSSLEPEHGGGQRGLHRAPAEDTRERHDFRQRPGPAGEPWFHRGGGVCPLVARPKEFALHPFWDRENRALFTAVGALVAADFCTTRANRASGGRELNPLTRVFSGSTPELATNFALETASTIGISYMFHTTGHHKLERITSFVNTGTSAGAEAYGLTHRWSRVTGLLYLGGVPAA